MQSSGLHFLLNTHFNPLRKVYFNRSKTSRDHTGRHRTVYQDITLSADGKTGSRSSAVK